MKKSKIKYIFELVFIFILPLLFILPNFSINKDFVYDNNGNFETSELALNYNTINYDTETITNEENIYLDTSNIFNYTTTDVYLNTTNNDNLFIASYLYSDNVDTYTRYVYGYYTYNVGGAWVVVEDGIYTDNINEIRQLFPPDDDLSYNYIKNNYNSKPNFEVIKNDIFYIVKTETITNTSIFTKIKDIISNNLLLDIDDTTFNIIIDYSCLWFIMFVIWHLFYLILDFLLHFWKKEDE